MPFIHPKDLRLAIKIEFEPLESNDINQGIKIIMVIKKSRDLSMIAHAYFFLFLSEIKAMLSVLLK